MFIGDDPNQPAHAKFRARGPSGSTPLSTWVHACLWLLLLLLPLRGFAAAQMTVQAAPAELHGQAHAACHGAPAALGDGHGDGHANADWDGDWQGQGQAPMGSTCACCLFCVPGLPWAATAISGLPPVAGPMPLAEPAATPDGVRDALFRPPRS